jgi:alpha-glucosidase
VLSLYRQALRARRDIDGAASLDWLETGRDDVLAFRRGALVVVTVFGDQPFAGPVEWGEPLVTSGSAPGTTWYRAPA